MGAKFTAGTSWRDERGRHTQKLLRPTLAASLPVVAEPPTRAQWGYSLAVVDDGIEVTETWELPPEGSAYEKMFGDDASQEIAKRSDWAKDRNGHDIGCHQKCG